MKLGHTFGWLLLSLSSPVCAADIKMAGGSVHFNVPEQWPQIMQSTGDPEVLVFEAPDPAAHTAATLARVSVTVKQVDDIAAFQQYLANAQAKARQLPDYADRPGKNGLNSYAYAAKEGKTPYSYRERYWLKDHHAIQLRCVRPAQSGSGASWSSAFDRTCDVIADNLGY